jgi:hypothetical protein
MTRELQTAKERYQLQLEEDERQYQQQARAMHPSLAQTSCVASALLRCSDGTGSWSWRMNGAPPKRP